ncbi:DNA gyrase subunit A [Myxococcota bacterium]|nr:DNA gyrase subunit A [Myxococcota bacterium]MBU1431306.1 DNA gyrase subunit A [Myxococcota bacterium]MBU1898930.1 DNA gyrase subunit A [Myxococcota bacterium]
MDGVSEGRQLVNIEDEMRISYLDYAMSVIIGRALPDVRDGLKPVHRRVLYTMYELKNNWNSAYKKSARVVGDCIGKYHPHGDSAVYDTIVRMAQDFSLRYMLVDGQGNFGSVDGDPAAAMRYTEVRMARVAHELLADIDRDTVDFGPTYDESGREPLVLPTKIPNLLVNGSAGIAVGMATNIPPHNLNEVINACVALIDNPEMDRLELMEHIPGPDFPTGGIIQGVGGIHQAYESGRGIIRVRAVTSVEEIAGSTGRERVVVTELPYQVNKARLLEKIAGLVREKKLEGISDLRDESDRQGMRMVIELKRGAQAQVVLNQLYKLTPLQSSFGINMVAIVHGEPRVLSLKEILEHFIAHRREVTARRCRFELRKLQARAHILEGYHAALDSIDRVINVIRGSGDSDDARGQLMEGFGLSEKQAQAILDLRLRRLTGMEREEILRELGEVRGEIDHITQILSDPALLSALIRAELEEVRERYGDVRRSQIVRSDGDLELEDLIPVEDMIVTITREGYIKRVPLSEYRTQRRGGRGKTGMSTKDTDLVEHLFVASTHSTMLFFTNEGQVYSEKVFRLPKGSRQSRGRPIINLLPLEGDARLAMVLTVDEFVDGHQLLFATADGVVKKTDIMAYAHIRSTGIRAIRLKEGDRLIAVRWTTGRSDVLLATATGKAIRFGEDQVRSVSRGSSGVRGITLEGEDQVVGCVTFDPEEPLELLTCTSNGYGKRTDISQYRAQHRGGKGLIDIKTNERNGEVVGIIKVEAEGDEYLLVTNGGVIIRASTADVSVIGRNTNGVRLINLAEDERVVSIAHYAEEDEGEDEDAIEVDE